MMPPIVIIPSRNAANLLPCVAAVRKHEPHAAIMVVDDGLDFGADDVGHVARHWIRSQMPIARVAGKKPFVFARNINCGIHATGPGYRDVVLLNDDALLETPGGFSAMQREAARALDVGVISATTNIASNTAQYPRKVEQGRPEPYKLRIAPATPGFGFPSVAFVCVLIPGRTLERVGLLDERFTAYGWEDVDYCRRLRDAKLHVGIFDGCFVDHSKLTSTFRGGPRAPGPIEEGRRIYEEKWGR